MKGHLFFWRRKDGHVVRIGLVNFEPAMDGHSTSLDSGVYVVVRVEGGSSKALSLQVLHDQDTDLHENCAQCDNKIHLA